MATTYIGKFNFEDSNGKQVDYERLCISGYVSGEIFTLELKLEKSDLLLAKMLLKSDEKTPVVISRKATDDEKNDGIRIPVKNRSTDTIDLDDDDELDTEGLFN